MIICLLLSHIVPTHSCCTWEGLTQLYTQPARPRDALLLMGCSCSALARPPAAAKQEIQAVVELFIGPELTADGTDERTSFFTTLRAR